MLGSQTRAALSRQLAAGIVAVLSRQEPRRRLAGVSAVVVALANHIGIDTRDLTRRFAELWPAGWPLFDYREGLEVADLAARIALSLDAHTTDAVVQLGAAVLALAAIRRELGAAPEIVEAESVAWDDACCRHFAEVRRAQGRAVS